MSTSRRDFIRYVVAGSIAAGCPLDLSLMAAEPSAINVDGEHNETCHAIRDGHKFEHPPATQKHDVVIVGGGVSGLTSAYLMRDKDFLLLEKEPHWGGNSYLEEYNGVAYATGGAFSGCRTSRQQLGRNHRQRRVCCRYVGSWDRPPAVSAECAR